jgi:signal transduction histidine kinase
MESPQDRQGSCTDHGATARQGELGASEVAGAEPHLNRTVRLHHVIGRINTAMIRAGSRAALFESISRIAGESGLFSAMSVTLDATDPDSRDKGMCCCGSGTPGCFSAEFACRIGDMLDADRGSRGIVVFNDLAAESADRPWLQEAVAAGHGALASLPIKCGEAAIGRLQVCSRECHAFDDDFLETLHQLSEDIAFLLCRFDGAGAVVPSSEEGNGARRELQALLDHLQTTREDERQLISRELHDELGQSLSGLKLDIIALERSLGPADAKCAARLAHMKALIADALDETHRIVGARRPRVLEERGLACALEWLGSEFGERTGVRCHTTIDLPDSEYAEAVATTAFRCVQESLTNITRHAAASKVVITARQVGAAIKLCIVDDGLGLSGDFAERGRFGLLGLRQRAQALGGQMDVESGPRRGTTIKISLPALPSSNSDNAARPLKRWPNPAAANSPSMDLPT